MSLRHAVLALFVLASPADAQLFADDNGRVLDGVLAFDAVVSVTAPDAEPGVQVPANFEENLEDAFVLALRRDGVRVEADAPNYLTCRVQFLPSIIGG